MISVSTFISGTLATVDAVVNNFVNIIYTHLVHENIEVITLSFTFYIMLLGYRFLTHSQSTDLSNIMRHIIVMLCVYGMIVSWHLYNLLIYNIFTNEPARIAKIFISSAGKISQETNVATALDGIYEAVIDTTMGFFGQVNFSVTGLAFIIYAILVFSIGIIMCVTALILFIYAKMMMAIFLALGPIFILFVLWEPTKGMFSAWLRSLFSIAFIPIVTSAVLVLMLSVINETLPQISKPTESLQFYGIAPFLGLCFATTLILKQVLKICSVLSSGFSLSNISEGINFSRSLSEKSGVAPTVRKTLNSVKHKIYKTKHFE